ncbi:MAG: ParB/RepB/Spo0J family partition protein [Eubacteriales bacterium]
MAKNTAPQLKGFDDLFNLNDNTNQEKTLPSNIAIDRLKPFSKHPFKGYSTDKLQSLAESIKEQGVIVPVLVRPIEHKDYDYEIIAGHNRVEGSKLAGNRNIPCMIREMDDETAIILMVDSNLQQRETVLPSEKAWAYKYKLDAMKTQGKRNDLTSRQLVGKLEITDVIGENNNESGRQVQRFICLTKLIPELLEKLDERKISFVPAVEISYLKKQEQKDLFSILSREERFGIPLKQATLLKGISRNGVLTYEKIDKIIVKGIKDRPKSFKVPYKKVGNFFSPDTTPKEFEDTIVKALELWFSKRNKESEEAIEISNENSGR